MQTEGIQQKYLRKAGLLALITVTGMAPPLSTDMYLPSLPKMADYFGAATVVVNMTMVAFLFPWRSACWFWGLSATASDAK